MMIKVKTGVQPPILVLMAALTNAFENAQLLDGVPGELVITSGSDGTHMKGSRHYDYAALDVRSKTFADDHRKLLFVQSVIRRLGDPVEVGTSTGHGYQTKNGKWLGILEHM